MPAVVAQLVAAASVFLAAKVCDTPIKLHDVAKALFRTLNDKKAAEMQRLQSSPVSGWDACVSAWQGQDAPRHVTSRQRTPERMCMRLWDWFLESVALPHAGAVHPRSHANGLGFGLWRAWLHPRIT